MYTLSVNKEFAAYHFLFGEGWGKENTKHAHNYKVEIVLESPHLNEHGYLIDIVDLEKYIGSLVERYKNNTLNDLPEFQDINPSIENFSRVFCQAIAVKMGNLKLAAITARIFEDDIAAAAFRMEF